MKKTSTLLKGKIYRLYFLAIAVFIATVAYMPFVLSGQAAAYGQILDRTLKISSGVPGNTSTTYTFTFSIATGGVPVQGIKLIACTSSVSTYPGNTSGCVAPTGMSLSTAAYNAGAQAGWQGAAAFAIDATGANDCTPAANVLCLNRSDTTNQTADTPPTTRTLVLNTVTNPTTVNRPFYIGIETYQNSTYTAAQKVDFGATASAVVQTLTTNAAVAEVLNFCVGSTLVDDTTTNIANDCTAMTGTSINLGTLDTSAVNISPVINNGGDSQNAVAMVRSNAGNGTVVAYDAIQQSGTNHRGTLRISGATCNAVTNVFTDPCINAAGSQTVFTAGTEMFGMTVAGVNSGSTTSYTCTYGTPPGNTCDLMPLSGYIGAGTNASNATYGTTNGFAWDESGTAVNIASSATSTVKQIDDEALILKFAATPSITTPFGPYAAQTDFIAVPTY